MKNWILAAIAAGFVLFAAAGAFANTDNPDGCVPYGAGSGVVPQVVNYQVAAAQTIAKGDFVTLNTAGYVVVATATSARLLGVAGSSVSASALGDALKVYDDPRQIFICQVSGTVSRTDVDDTPLFCDIEGTTGIMEVDENATSYRVVQVLAAVPGQTYGSANAKVFTRIAQHLNSANPIVEGTIPGALVLASTLDVTGSADLTGGCDIDADSVALTIGASADLSCLHNGTDSICTSNVGDLVFDNVDINDQTIFTLGTDTNATSFVVEGNGGTDWLKVDGAGQVDIGKNLDASEGVDVDADSQLLTLGASADLALSHDGANNVVDSVLAGADLIMKLGDDLATSVFVVENNTGTDIMTIDATGQADIGGNLDVSGGVDIDADSQLLTLGASADLALSHDGANNVVDSVLAGADLIMKLGDDLATSVFVVENNTGTDIMTIDATGQADIGGNLDVSGGVDIDADSQLLSLGASADLTLTHNGTDSIVDSALAGADLIMKLGDDLATSIFIVENNTGTDWFKVDGTGQATFAGNVAATAGATITGDLSYTGHKDGQILLQQVIYAVHGAAGEWQIQAAVGDWLLGAAVSNKDIRIRLNDLKVGDELVSFRLLGNMISVGGNVTIQGDAGVTPGQTCLTRVPKNAGALAVTEVGCLAAPYTVAATTALDLAVVLGAAHTVLADNMYFLNVEGTTAAATTISLIGAEITDNRK